MNIRNGLTDKFNQSISSVNNITDPRQTALIWASAGAMVLPKAKGRKDPNLKGWQDIHCTDAQQINQWYNTGRYDGVILKPSLITLDNGQQAYLVFLDCDGQAVYEAVCNQFPILRDTRTELTGSGKGYRIPLIVDKLPSVGKGKITRKGILGTDHLGFEIFIRTGGVVVAPSIHPKTQQRYKLINPAPILHIDRIDELVQWALSLPAKNDKKKRENTRPANIGPSRDVPPEVSAAIARALHIEHVNSEGWSDSLNCIFGKHEHAGGAGWNIKTNCFQCFKCGQTWNAKETAAVLGIEWPKGQRLKRSVQHRAQKQLLAETEQEDVRKIVEHISDDLPPAEIAKHRSLLIEGQTGQGKTHALGKYAQSLSPDNKLTVMAQFRLLLEGMKKYFPNADHYRDTTPEYQAMLAAAIQLLISISSAHKIDRTNSDVLIIDELAGVLKFLVSSDTFKRDEAITAFRILKQWVSSAKQFIGGDANLSQIETDFINLLRGNDVVVKRYRRAVPRGTVTLLKDSITSTWRIKRLLMHKKGVVYVVSSSEKKTTELFDLFSGGEYRVMKITRDTSNTPEVDRFIADKDYRAQFDLVIYDPALGSGVDISEPVYALVAIFDRMPLDPESAIQLFGRVRNAQRYYAAVPAASEGYETLTAEQLKAERLKRELWTAKQHGQIATQSGTWLEMLDLWSKYEERRLREVARWRHYFVERLKNNGFKVQWHDVGISKEFRALFTEWRANRREQDWEFVQAAIGLTMDDATLEKIRLGRQEITHELRLRNTRYKIETVKGSDQVLDQDRDLMSPQNRAALYRAITRRNQDALEFDANESVDGVPLQKRRYSYAETTVVSHLLKHIGFDGKPAEQDEAFIKFFLQERTDIELKERFPILISEDCTNLFKKLGHQTENANTVIGRLKWILNYLWGMKLVSRRQGRDKNRIMLYHIENDVVIYLLSRREWAAIAARQVQAEKCTINLLNKRESRFVVHTPSLVKVTESLTWLPPAPKPYARNPIVQGALA